MSEQPMYTARSKGPGTPCRADQIFAAGNRVINLSRRIGEMPMTTSLAEMAEKLTELKHAVATFDRLNRGLGPGEG